jgi:hypothetical protein
MSTLAHGILCGDGSNDTSSSVASLYESEHLVRTGDDATMNFATGSVIFSISGVRFKVPVTEYVYRRITDNLQIPKALLQQHSEGFSAMLDMKSNSESEEQAIELSDSFNAFLQFRKVLFTSVQFHNHCSDSMNHFSWQPRPLESCLFSDEEDSAHICDLLDLLAISHKYCASAIETRTVGKLIDLTAARRVADLDISVHLRILETAVLIGSNELGRASRTPLLRSMWLHTSDACKAPLDHPVKILAYGKGMHDKEMIGAAYYAIMCNGREWWASHDGVEPVDRRRLEQGMMRCAKEWHDIQTKWAVDGFGCHLKCNPKRDILHASLGVQAERGIAWYDIVGKINATLSGRSGIMDGGCRPQISQTVRGVLTKVRSELYDYFTETI